MCGEFAVFTMLCTIKYKTFKLLWLKRLVLDIMNNAIFVHKQKKNFYKTFTSCLRFSSPEKKRSEKIKYLPDFLAFPPLSKNWHHQRHKRE